MRYHYIHIKIAIIKDNSMQKNPLKYSTEDEKQIDFICTADRDVKWYPTSEKDSSSA